MSNPFLRRATEYIRDDSAFLAVVSPEPLRTFVVRHAKRDALFDLPVRVIGSPGSGKTMMATLIEFRLVETILRDQASESNRVLASALASAMLVVDLLDDPAELGDTAKPLFASRHFVAGRHAPCHECGRIASRSGCRDRDGPSRDAISTERDERVGNSRGFAEVLQGSGAAN